MDIPLVFRFEFLSLPLSADVTRTSHDYTYVQKQRPYHTYQGNVKTYYTPGNFHQRSIRKKKMNFRFFDITTNREIITAIRYIRAVCLERLIANFCDESCYA